VGSMLVSGSMCKSFSLESKIETNIDVYLARRYDMGGKRCNVHWCLRPHLYH
jgi:hypothetical protein